MSKNGGRGVALSIDDSKYVTFVLGRMTFEYDENKNKINIEKHGISFKSAACVFFDYDRIELYDEENSNATNFERGLYYGKY